ncbi:MAG: CoB--CoM heterodisulfide reductase iron-sulfur subunit A family protein, partial [Nitrospirae bacterium]|nr:CoB--CoM heterodisulfide reductase iron-sulfur subunit A family protein [Nitrospirota bacterium]
MSRIGVFVCQCGNNIKDTVDTAKVAEEAKTIPGVVHTENCGFLCSNPGQQLIKEIIKTNKLDKVVVAACSPHMHEKTFRKASEAVGLNPFEVEIANIREHCSWVHHDPTKQIGTDKSLDITRMTVERIRKNSPLEKIKVAVTKRALVIGGGVAGIQAALDIAEGGHEVVLVEKEPSIGGQMSKLSETFPTMDCSQCILTPKMVECAQHPNITLYTYSEVESVDGFVGNFTVTIRKKAKSVIEDKCTECGECTQKCPFFAPNDFDSGMAKRKLIDIPFPQAVPAIPVLDRSRCPKYTKGKMKCGVCLDVCGPDCIDFDQEDEFVTEKFGAIVVATGYDVMGVDRFPEFGGGRYKDVITGLDFERLASASGPTGGAMKRPSDGKEPRR